MRRKIPIVLVEHIDKKNDLYIVTNNEELHEGIFYGACYTLDEAIRCCVERYGMEQETLYIHG